MTSYNLLVLAVKFLGVLQLPLDAECLNRDQPPDPHPFLHFAAVLLFALAIATLILYLTRTVTRKRMVRRSSEEERALLSWGVRTLIKILERISNALAMLEKLRGKALRDQCEFVLDGLRFSLDFNLAMVRDYYMDYEPKDKVVIECLGAILRAGVRLRLHLVRTRAMLLFPPLLSRVCRRTMAAARDYTELVKLIQCCNAKLPESAIPVPAFELVLPNS